MVNVSPVRRKGLALVFRKAADLEVELLASSEAVGEQDAMATPTTLVGRLILGNVALTAGLLAMPLLIVVGYLANR